MEIVYKREARHNYMLLCPGETQEEASFEERMQQRLKGTCFLDLQVFYEGENLCYGYEISGMQPLSRLSRRGGITENLLCALVLSLDQAFLLIENHMLSETGLFLSEETVYVDTKTGDVRFCLVPGGRFAVQTELKALLYHLLGQIEAGRDRAVLLCHRLYRIAAEENTSIGALKAELFFYRKIQGTTGDQSASGTGESRMQYEEAEKMAQYGAAEAPSFGSEKQVRLYGRPLLRSDAGRRAEDSEAEDSYLPSFREKSKEESRVKRRWGRFDMGEADREGEETEAPQAEEAQEVWEKRRNKRFFGGKQLLLCSLILGAAPVLTGLLRGPAAVFRMLPVFGIIDLCVIAYLVLNAVERKRRGSGMEADLREEWGSGEGSEEEPKEVLEEAANLRAFDGEGEETKAYGRNGYGAGIPVFQDLQDMQREREQQEEEAGRWSQSGTGGWQKGRPPEGHIGREQTEGDRLGGQAGLTKQTEWKENKMEAGPEPDGEEARRLVPMDPGMPALCLPHFPVIIGKDGRYADQVIKVAGVSDMHLRIDKIYDAYTLSDLNAEQGTLLSGKLLNANETVPLYPGQEIGIGAHRYLFL